MSRCPLPLIFSQDKASFIHFSCSVFHFRLLGQNWCMGEGPPQFKTELGEVECRMCRMGKRKDGEEQEVLGAHDKKAEGSDK